MNPISEFSDSEMPVTHPALRERYGEQIRIEHAASEVRPGQGEREPTGGPALFRQPGNCNFIRVNTGDMPYRCRFFCRVHQYCETGVDEPDDPAEGVVRLLRAQAGHERELPQEAQQKRDRNQDLLKRPNGRLFGRINRP